MANPVPVTITINGKARKANVEPRLLLAHFLREDLGLTGTHIGCDTSQCGACTVMIDGHSAKSCTIFAAQADGSEILTIEGVATPMCDAVLALLRQRASIAGVA